MSSEIFAFQQLGYYVWRSLVIANVVDAQNVWMVERRNRLGLLGEAADAIRVRCKRRRQNLDGHITAKPRVTSTIDLAHCTDANELQNPITAKLLIDEGVCLFLRQRLCSIVQSPRLEKVFRLAIGREHRFHLAPHRFI